MPIKWVRKDVMLLGERGNMAIVTVRKDVMLLGGKGKHGYSEST